MRKKLTGGICTLEHHRIHWWLRKNYGEVGRCFNPICKWGDSWRTQYALIEGKEYKKDVTHYIPLCGYCHVQYDRLLRGWEDTEESQRFRLAINEIAL